MNSFTRTEIESNKNIKLVDENTNNNLNLFCYVSCGDEDEEIVKRSRGVIFNGDEKVLDAFPYTENVSIEEEEKIKKIDGKLVDCVCFNSLEGTLIRMFFYKDGWVISTNRKLDAYKSKWSSLESFGKLFEKSLESMYKDDEKIRKGIDVGGEGSSLLEKFQSLLDKEKQYMFLLQNNRENRIVCDGTDPRIYHCGTFEKGKLSLDDEIIIPYSSKERFESMEEIFKYIENQDIRKVQGVIIFDVKNNLQYKVENEEYKKLSRLRGNEPSVKFRYIQIRMDNDIVKEFSKLYPDYIPKFEEYENRIYEICKKIYTAYVTRFIKKEYVQLPKEDFFVLSKAHKWHLENKETNKMDLNKIISIFNNEFASNINRMIKRQIMENYNLTNTTVTSNDEKKKYSLLQRRVITE